MNLYAIFITLLLIASALFFGYDRYRNRKREPQLTFDELRRAVTLVCSSLNIVGCDVNELSPVYDQSGVSTAVACKVIREMLLAMS